MRTSNAIVSLLVIVSMMLGMFLVVLTTPGLAPVGAKGQEVMNPSIIFNMPCTASAYVQSAFPGTNSGTAGNGYVVSLGTTTYPGPIYTGTDFMRQYWKFDISTLPSNLIIDSATAYFYIQQVQNWNYTASGFDNFGINLLKPTSNWSEGTITWNNQPYAGATSLGLFEVPRMAPGNIPGYGWPDVNGTFHPDDPVNYTNMFQNFYSYFPVDLTAITQYWQFNPNYGLMMDTSQVGYNAMDTVVQFVSRFVSFSTPSQNAPYLEIVGHSAETQVHISYYDSFTGEGIAPWSFNVSASVGGGTYSRISPDITNGLFGDTLTIRVRDFFGNELYNQTRTLLTSVYYWDIGLPIYSYKFYTQNPTFALLRIYYNLTGTPYSEFIPPYDHVDRYLHAGTYRFMITFYSETGITGNTYTWIRTIPSSTFPGAGFVILKGDTISEAIIAANGAKAVAQVIAQLVNPSMVWVGYTVPQIPAYLLTISSFVINQNLYMVNGASTTTSVGKNVSFKSPIPDDILSASTTRDLFSFSGPAATHVMVNRSSDNTNLLNSAVVPSPTSLAGYNSTAMTVWSSNNLSTTRDGIWRFYRSFTYQFNPKLNEYKTEVTVTDTQVNWSNVTMFIPFSNASYVNNRSVSVYDLNNTVYLTEGVHWLQSKSGIYLWFNSWNFGVSRGFRVTYNAVNESQFNLPVHILVNQLGNGQTTIMTWNNKAFYFAVANWTNNFREDYKGVCYITLDMPVSIDESSVIILQGNGAVVTDAIIGTNTIVIPQINVKVGDPIEFIILFESKSTNVLTDAQIFGIPVLYIVLVLAIVGFVVGVYLYVAGGPKSREQIVGKFALGIATLALIILFFMVLISGVT